MTARSLAMAAPGAITTTRERKRLGLGWMELVVLLGPQCKLELVALVASTCLYFPVSKPACVIAKVAFLTVEQYVFIQLTSIQAGVKLRLTDSSTTETPKTN